MSRETATPSGADRPPMVATTVSVTVLITLSVLPAVFATYTSSPVALTATPVGWAPTGMVVRMALVSVPITLRVAES
ncbi:hypothetical protein GCM10020254_04860 [Streptomyces goshikiensis]